VPTSPLHPLCWTRCRRRHACWQTWYDAGSLRARLKASGTEAVIPSTRSGKIAIPYDATAYVGRNLIERAFCRLKDWRRVATRYDKLANNFASTVAIAAIILWWT
jgi:putative transposase